MLVAKTARRENIEQPPVLGNIDHYLSRSQMPQCGPGMRKIAISLSSREASQICILHMRVAAIRNPKAGDSAQVERVCTMNA